MTIKKKLSYDDEDNTNKSDSEVEETQEEEEEQTKDTTNAGEVGKFFFCSNIYPF